MSEEEKVRLQGVIYAMKQNDYAMCASVCSLIEQLIEKGLIDPKIHEQKMAQWLARLDQADAAARDNLEQQS